MHAALRLCAILCVAHTISARILWVGSVTATSATIASELLAGETAATLVLAMNPSLTSVVASTPITAIGTATKLVASGLSPQSLYYYGIPGRSNVGSFKTFATGAFSYRVGFASCALTGSNNEVFDRIRLEQPDLFLHMGDLHYEDDGANVTASHYATYQRVFAQSKQAALYQSTAIAYMWDDHDFAYNNADGNVPGRYAVRAAYENVVPHYPLQTNQTGYGPIYQAFTIGRVRYIFTDLRSFADFETFMGEESMLGAYQREWLLTELASFASYSLVVWMSTKPWQGTPLAESDKWRGYEKERTYIANWIASHGVNNLIMLAGDAHLVAADDGANNDYSDNGGAGFPLFQSAPMDNYGSDKGSGPYNLGMHGYKWWISNHYSVLDIHDDGVNPLTFSVRGMSATDGERRVVFNKTFSLPCVKNGTRSGKPGVSVKTLPLVPSFVYISLALTIISFIICTTMSGIWSLWHWRYEAKVYAVHGTKRTARPDQFPHATPVGAPTDELVASMPVKGGVSASGGTVSINPLMMANAASSSGSPAPKQMLLVVEPLPGDPLAPPSPASR